MTPFLSIRSVKLFVSFISMFFLFLGLASCKKEYSCEGCANKKNNRPPIAIAGSDHTISLPSDSVLLDGSGSTDPDGTITEWLWNKISGPASASVVNNSVSKTVVKKFTTGIYLFELTVKDNGGLSGKDTVQVSVNASIPPPPPPPPPPPQGPIGNLIFYFPDPTGSMDAVKINTISFDPSLKLVLVKIDNYPEGHIDGMWCNNCAPRCPISSDYLAEFDNYTSFILPPGTYTWTAQTVFQNFNGYPFDGSIPFPTSLISFFALPRTTSGNVTILPNDNCLIQKIVF